MYFLITFLVLIVFLLLPLFIRNQHFILYGLLITELFFGMYVGEGNNISRSFLIFRAACEAFFLLLFLYNYLVRLSLNKPNKKLTNFPFRKIMFLLIIVNIISLLIGLLLGNNINYIIGDFYKYTKGVLIIFITWYILKDLFDVHKFLQRSVYIYSIFIGVYLYKFYFVFSQFRIFHTSVQESITFILIILYLNINNNNYKNKLDYCFNWVVFFMSLFALLISQTRTFLILFAIMCFFILIYSLKQKKLIRFVGITIIFMVILSPILVNNEFLQDSFDKYLSRIQYTFIEKSNQNDFLGGGSRLGEIKDVINQYTENPLALFSGFGLGRYVYDVMLGIREHYLHNASFEILLRTGLLGLLSYVFFYFKVLLASNRLYKRKKEFWWLSVVVINQLIYAQFFTQIWDSMPLYFCIGIIVLLSYEEDSS